jgi:hypothetical protein
MHAPAPAADFDRSPGLTITEGSTSAEFGGRHFSLRFSKNDGVITSYVDKGMALLERGPRPDFWRATTDNDAGAWFAKSARDGTLPDSIGPSLQRSISSDACGGGPHGEDEGEVLAHAETRGRGERTMKRPLFVWAILLTMAHGAALTAPNTIRIDYYHTGNASQELFSLDEVVLEPLPWPGNPDRAIDDTNLGKYLFEVRDRGTNSLLYSRGFASVYGEWELTGEAKSMNRTFSESIRFPAPEKAVQVILKKRDSQNSFREVWTLTLDPKDKFIKRAKPSGGGPAIEIERHGDPEKKLDFLIIGDGYAAAERGKFEKDARRLAGILFETEPFKSRRADFNIWAICPTSEESGITKPSSGIYRRSPLGATYDAFGSERYILTFENRAFREIASWAPYEFAEILVNNATYGGGGIFGLYGTVAADSFWAPYIFVHEFGHHLAGLADEYYTSDVPYTPLAEKVEPWEPNVTALLDPSALKWGSLVAPGTPLPTPWSKEAFEGYSREMQDRHRQLRKEKRPESEIDALFIEEREREDKMLREGEYAAKVGAFEGANYEEKGYYRPQTNCIMFTRSGFFCQVCRMALSRVMDLYSGRSR